MCGPRRVYHEKDKKELLGGGGGGGGVGGRIANVFYVIFIIFSPVGHFSGDPHAVPPQKWVSGGFWGVLRQKT